MRSELQADCYAGAWIAGASQTTDDDGGAPVLVAPTQQEMNDALDAAKTIGDDRLQQMGGGGVNPEGWTHGSSEQRMRWLTNGYNDGVTDYVHDVQVDSRGVAWVSGAGGVRRRPRAASSP